MLKHLKVGIRLESLGLPLRKAIDEATRIGVGGVQFDAVGDLSPDRLSDSGRRELRQLLRARGLELTSLNCPLRHGLDVAEDQQPRIDFVRKVMTLAYELGPRVVTVQAGQVPEKEDEPRAALLRDALSALGRHGDRVGTTLALETGLESGEVLANYLATFDAGGLGADLVPGNLLVHGLSPFQAARDLTGRIAIVHAKDGRRASTSRAAREVPLGSGDVDWLAFLELLAEVEYRGWLVVARDEGDRRSADVEAGVRFLERLIELG